MVAPRPCSACSPVKWDDPLGPWGQGESDGTSLWFRQRVDLRAAGPRPLQTSCWAQCCHVSLGPGNTVVFHPALSPPASVPSPQAVSLPEWLEPGTHPRAGHTAGAQKCQSSPQKHMAPRSGLKHHRPIQNRGLPGEAANSGAGTSRAQRAPGSECRPKANLGPLEPRTVGDA